MPDLLNFILDPKWISKLWAKLNQIQTSRNEELLEINNVFGDSHALAKVYVEQDCQVYNPANYSEYDPISQVRVRTFEFFRKFLKGEFREKDGRHTLFILSDAGMGKTSLLVMMKLTHMTSFWPQNYHCRLLKISSDSISKIREIPDKMRTVLLLDALDEDTGYSGKIEKRLIELLSETENFRQVIITCRTQFFPDDVFDPCLKTGHVKINGYTCNLIYLSPFDDDQVIEFLKIHFPARWRDYLFHKKNNIQGQAGIIIKKMHSLQNRPLLLSYIDDIVSDSRAFENEYTIYLTMVNKWLEREERTIKKRNSNSKTTSKSLLFSCIKITNHMLRTSSKTIKREELDKLISNNPVLNEIQLIDVRGRSLLNKNSDGDFRFSHHTIQEFLIVYGLIHMTELFQKADIPFTELMNTFLQGCRSYKDNLSRAIREANLKGINLRKANLICADLTRANLSESKFIESIFRKANFNEANISNAKLIESDLRDATLRRANLFNVDLRNAYLQDADFRYADLREANLAGADLRRANFSRANLSQAKLCQADLSGAVLFEANMTSTDLSRALLVEANLSKANLANAILNNANLKLVNLIKTNLSGTSFIEADLNNAYLWQRDVFHDSTMQEGLKELTKAKSLYKAKLDRSIADYINEKFPCLFEEPS